MKTIKIFIAIFVMVGFSTCGVDEGTNPKFRDNELYIYDDKPQAVTAIQGEEFIWDMFVSPNDGSIVCRWMIDGVVISATQNLTYTFNHLGVYTLRFEAMRNGVVNYREYQLEVLLPPEEPQ
jgi:hypothetical protein